MPVTINGTTGIAGVDGSAATPAIQGSDTNTGIFYPAIDTVAVATGGSERMRVDSSGNVGIGTSSSGGLLGLYGTSSLTTPVININYEAASADAVLATKYSTDVNPPQISQQKARGTVASPSAAAAGDAAGQFPMRAYTGTSFRTVANIVAGIDSVVSDTNVSGHLRFQTNSGGTSTTERMRITPGGEVYIAGTTDQGAYNLQCNGTGVWGAGAYTNGSDARIKEDIAPIESGLDVVAKLNPVTYRYKEDWSKDQSVQTGFIAQELLVALEGKNYVEGVVQQGGAAGYYSVAYQNIIPLLTKAIQELSAKVDAQAAEIEALKGAQA